MCKDKQIRMYEELLDELSKHKDEQELIDLVIEYYRLVSLEKLDTKDEERVMAILNLAIIDETLSQWIGKVDAKIADSLGLSNTSNRIDQKVFKKMTEIFEKSQKNL